jgi:ribonuclease R
MSRRDWRFYRERQRGRGRGRARARPKNAREAIEGLLDERLGRRGFPAALEHEAAHAADTADGGGLRRRDLTELPTFTVDPATARDFDDAISARSEDDALRLWVHIADVAAHVKPGSPLDLEARRRSNSTYAPGAVEPMLPRALSEEACSLAPGVERLAVTAEVELGPDGHPRAASFYRSRIRSSARLDYDELDLIFAGRAIAPGGAVEPLAVARTAAVVLGERRGVTSLDIDSTEPEFRFDSDGNVVSAREVAHTEAHRLIERLMILANEQVAQLLERKRVPAIYRVHARPDPDRVEWMIKQLGALGVPTPPVGQGLSASQAGEVAAETSRLLVAEAARRGHGREAYSSLLLRSLMQAQYSDRNSGHAGLGSPAYCHFTSPIRRYADLLVHRALLATLGEGEAAPKGAEAREVAFHCSERERESARIERDADDICAAYLLERELGQRGAETEFEGEVSGTIRAGAFVIFGGELGDVYEGLVPARTIGSERFELNETETALVGSESGNTLRLGDPISVRATGVEPARGRIDLELVNG